MRFERDNIRSELREGALPGQSRYLAAGLLICLALLNSCHRSQSKAVEQAVQNHLKQNRHLVADSYSTKIERITFNGGTADALVRFESKQSANLFVEVDYGLRLENGRWEVTSSTPVGGLGGDSHRPRDSNMPSPAATQPGLTPQPSH